MCIYVHIMSVPKCCFFVDRQNAALPRLRTTAIRPASAHVRHEPGGLAPPAPAECPLVSPGSARLLHAVCTRAHARRTTSRYAKLV